MHLLVLTQTVCFVPITHRYDKDNISDSVIKKVEPYIQVCTRICSPPGVYKCGYRWARRSFNPCSSLDLFFSRTTVIAYILYEPFFCGALLL